MTMKRDMTPEQKQKALEIGKRIRALREQKEYTQEEFGPMIGLSEGASAQWETGRVIPKMSNLKKIADALDTTTEYLWAGDDPDEQAKAHTNRELRVLKAMRQMSPEKAEALLTLIESQVPPSKK